MEQQQIPWQQPQLAPAPGGGGRAALQYGLLCGGIVGLIDVIYAYLLDNGTITLFNPIYQALARLPYTINYTFVSIIISIPIYILLFVAFLLAGIFAARKSKRLASGVLAGLWAGGAFLAIDLLIAGILLTIVVVFPQLVQGPYPLTGTNLTNVESTTMTSVIIYSLVADLLLVGIGALIGLLGGAIGKGGSAPAPTQYYAAPYTPNPYPPQRQPYGNPYSPPAQPGQPGQPTPPPPYPPDSGQ